MFGLNYTCMREVQQLIRVLKLGGVWGEGGGLLGGVLVCWSFGGM